MLMSSDVPVAVDTGTDTTASGTDAERMTTMYRWMALSRAIEDRLARMHGQGLLRGRLISGRGQEAIPVGAAMALGSRSRAQCRASCTTRPDSSWPANRLTTKARPPTKIRLLIHRAR